MIIEKQNYVSKLFNAFPTVFLILVNLYDFCTKYKQQPSCHSAKLTQILFAPARADDWLKVLGDNTRQTYSNFHIGGKARMHFYALLISSKRPFFTSLK